jgi:hypothetical protein
MDRALLFLSRAAARREPLVDSPIDEAREALDYWSRRAERLPWYRRAHRREARVLAARWRVRLMNAHLERMHLSKAERMLTPLLDTGRRTGAAHFRWLAWRTLRRTVAGRIVLMTAAAALTVGLASVAVVGALAIHAVA